MVIEHDFYIDDNTDFFECDINKIEIRPDKDLMLYIDSDKYDIDQRQIFFRDEFNEDLDPYLELISKCNKNNN